MGNGEHELNVALAAIAGLILLLGVFSRPLKRSWLSIPLVAMLAGVVLGPLGLGWLDPTQRVNSEVLLEQAARLTMAIAVMAIALRLPAGFPSKHWRGLGVVLGLGMPLMWLAGALVARLLLDLPWPVALLVGAVITPTDPVVATAIVTGSLPKENLPAPLRHLISAESAANDGLALPLVMLPILLMSVPAGQAWGDWLLDNLLWQIGGGILVGAFTGAVAGWLLVWAEVEHSIDRSSFLSYTVALSLLVLGGADLLAVNSIFAVFIAGVAFDQVVGGRERAEEEKVQESINQFFTLPVFVLFGLMIPWEQWGELGWRGVAMAVAVLLVRRLPALLLLKPLVGEWPHWRDALWTGWFGPIGVAAMFYAMHAVKSTGDEGIWAVTSLVVCASLVAHGVTAAPLTRLYGRKNREAGGP